MNRTVTGPWRAACLALSVVLAACASPGPEPVAGGVSPAPSQGQSAPAQQQGAPAPEPAVFRTEEDAIEGYRLDQGDRISIQVFDEPDLTMESRIGASGVINYSYLGDLSVRNKTAQQVEREIIRLLSDGYLVNPSVNVSVVEYRPFFINGEVRSPGGYPYQPGLTLDKAIALAGGLSDRASTRRMFVVRAGGEGDEIKARMNTQIAPGDIISIKEGFF